MNIGIGSAQHFWTFDLARQMERFGHLGCLYTGYPQWKVDRALRDKVRSFPWEMGPATLASRLGIHSIHRGLQLPAARWFDRCTARSLEPCDIFHCVSLFGLESYGVAKQRCGVVTVCDRGSSHILFQDWILSEEYARWGIPYRAINPDVIERELCEYANSDLIAVPSEFVHRTFLEQGVYEKN